jgi:hypothetical protein
MLAGKNPDAQMKALEAANKGWDKPPAPPQTFSQTTTTTMGPGGMQRSMSSSMGMPMHNPLADATSLPIFEAGDPTHRNMRNDY